MCLVVGVAAGVCVCVCVWGVHVLCLGARFARVLTGSANHISSLDASECTASVSCRKAGFSLALLQLYQNPHQAELLEQNQKLNLAVALLGMRSYPIVLLIVFNLAHRRTSLGARFFSIRCDFVVLCWLV